MMEEREAQAKAIVEGIESQWSEVGERAERRERALKEDVERETRRADEAERRLEHLQRVMQKVDMGELPLPPGTPARVGGDVLTQGIAGLSPTVAMASRAQRTGRTFTEVYADYVKVQDELAKRNAEFDHMERTLGAVLAQIEERVSNVDRFAASNYLHQWIDI
jgi:nucleoprotein TPR